MYNKYSEFSLYGYWIVLIFKHFQIQIRVWRWLFESLYKRTRREISLWQTWLWILWYSNATCCQNRGSQISITIQGKKQFYDSYHILIKFGFFLILIWVITDEWMKWLLSLSSFLLILLFFKKVNPNFKSYLLIGRPLKKNWFLWWTI